MNEASVDEKNRSATAWDVSAPWEVIGWHPDSQHLLLGGAGIRWVDLLNNSYESIYFDIKREEVLATKSHMSLLPNGTGFVYVTSSMDDRARQKLNLFDFAKKNSQVILEWSTEYTRLYFPRISPNNEQLTFLVEQGRTGQEVHYSLQLFSVSIQPLTDLTGTSRGATYLQTMNGPSWCGKCRSSFTQPE
jgi:hypothetical protein